MYGSFSHKVDYIKIAPQNKGVYKVLRKASHNDHRESAHLLSDCASKSWKMGFWMLSRRVL